MFDVGITIQHGSGSDDVVVRLDPDADGRTLYRALERKVGISAAKDSLVLARTGAEIPTDASIASLDIRWGDRLLVQPGKAPSRTGAVHFLLECVSGPDIGAVLPLEIGENLVGRGSPLGGVTLHDPSMSRRHARFVASQSGLTVTDLGSSNGILVGGQNLSGSVPIPMGSVLQLGDNVFRLADGASPAIAAPTAVEGVLPFNRQPRLPDPDPSRVFTLATPPVRPAKRRLPMTSAIAPALISVVMVLALPGHPIYYLFIAGLSPVVLVFNALDDRRSGRKKFVEDSARYRKTIAKLTEQIRDAAIAESAWASRRWPDLSNLQDLVRNLDSRLWWRRTTDSDFLDLRIGICEQPSRLSVRYSPGGDEELDAAAAEVTAMAARSADSPAVVHLRTHPILGVAGPPDLVGAHARWLVAQMVTAHSPRDVALCLIAPGRGDEWTPIKWLPHLSTLDPAHPSIAVTEDSALSLFSLVHEIAQQRRAAHEDTYAGAARPAPEIVVLVQPPLPVQRRLVTELLERASDTGISVIWLASERRELPGECSVVVELEDGKPTGVMSETGAERSALEPTVEDASAGVLLSLSVGLAPVRDATSGSRGGPVPAHCDLLDLLHLEDLEATAVVSRWASPPSTLQAPIGYDGNGVVDIDLELDGPHGLVAGTTGSGKSELLQTLVASLALSHAPSRVNFVLIDYKGGSAFKSCQHLPHTVGFVTDLDGHLAERAMRSLEAEQAYRERVITVEGGARDLIELRRRNPESAPPSLLIVVDEFAFLAQEVPEFIDRLVDIARRGRSLGIHMLLATQRPSGVISPHIAGNTELRVALRVASASDSNDVLERPDAAMISNRSRGRALLKAGNRSLQSFQTAFVGGDTSPAAQDGPDGAVTFRLPSLHREALALARHRDSGSEITDLDRIVAATKQAFDQLELPEPRKPWLDPLKQTVRWEHLAARVAGSDRGLVSDIPPMAVAVGLADLPDLQDQGPWLFDPVVTPNLLIYGGSGSGKTTALRTIAIALAARFPPCDLHYYALDFGHEGLRVLDGLPHWGGSASSGELDKVHRLIAILTELVADRRHALGTNRSGSAADFRAHTGEPMPEVVVFIDNLAGLASAMEPVEELAWISRLHRLIADGRGVGLHFIMTADRPGAVPSVISSAVQDELVLRMANPQDYGMLGKPKLMKSAAPPVGRAFTRDGTEVQIAIVGDPEDVTISESDRVATVAAAIRQEAIPSAVPPLELLPTLVHIEDAGIPTPKYLPFALDEDHRWVGLDLADNPYFLIVGPDKSGRSSTLGTLVGGLRRAEAGLDFHLLATRDTPLAGIGGWASAAATADEAVTAAARLADLATKAVLAGDALRFVVVIDDGDDLVDATSSAATHIESIRKVARDLGGIVLASVSTFKAQRSYSLWLGAMRNNRQGLLLAGSSENSDVFQARLPRSSGSAVAPGRGYLFTPSGHRLVQVAV